MRGAGEAQKLASKEQCDPKPYPLSKGDWSLCDESDEDSHWDLVTASMGF